MLFTTAMRPSALRGRLILCMQSQGVASSSATSLSVGSSHRRNFNSPADYAQYIDDVKRSCLARPADAVEVPTQDMANEAPFLASVDPMASHLRLWGCPSRFRSEGSAGKSAASTMIEATWPLSSDSHLRTSVADLHGQRYATFRLGKFYEAVDGLTADVAYRHTDGHERGLALVTASHAHARKLESTNIEENMSLRCYVTRTGGSSLEIRTDAVQARGASSEVLVNSCATTMVALDKETMRPARGAVPALGPPDEVDSERARIRDGIVGLHSSIQRRRAASSMQLRTRDSHPPQPEEMDAIHGLYRSRFAVRNAGSREKAKAKIWSVDDATYRSSFVVFPEQRNVHGKAFGGFVVSQAHNLAHYAARFFSEDDLVVPLGLDDAIFSAPIAIGDCVTFTARVVQSTAYTCRVNVSVEVRDPARPWAPPEKSNRLVFFFALRAPPLGIIPTTYQEILMHVDATRTSRVEGPSDDEALGLLEKASEKCSKSEENKK